MTLPRLHVVTDERVLARADFGERLATLVSLGPRVAVHLRDRVASGRAFWSMAERWATVVSEAGAMLVVNARPDVAALLGAQAVQLGGADLTAGDARAVAPHTLIGRSVHSRDEATRAVSDGADFLLAGPVHATPTHPGVAGAGVSLLAGVMGLGRPVIAIGGVTPARASEMHAAGAWGVAVIRAVWDAPDPLRAAGELLAPWARAA